MKTLLVQGTTPITERDDIIIKITITQGNSEVFKDEHLNLTLETQFVPQALIGLMTSMTLGENSLFEMDAEYFNQNFTEHIPPVTGSEKVTADVTIKEVSKVEDLFNDGRFYFRIIEKTREKKDPEATRVHVHYRFEIKNMTYIENIDQRPIQVMFADRKVPELWKLVLSRMNPGEHARVECNLTSPDLDLINNGKDVSLNIDSFKPQDASVGYLYLKGVSFDTGLYTEELDSEERNKLGLALKEEGNSFFKSNNFEKAAKVYISALSTLEPYTDDPAVFKNSCALVLGNLSLCYLKMLSFAEAERYATHALELNPNEAKFLLRRAQAKIGNSLLDSALEDLKIAQEHASEDLIGSIKKEIQGIKQEFQRVQQEEKERYKNLFK